MTISDRKTILVIGGSRGIGLATVEYLLKHKSKPNVVAFSRSATPELENLAGKHSSSLLISRGDASKELDVKQAVDATVQAYGRLDGLILNHGCLEPIAPICSSDSKTSATLSQWRETFEINFFSLVTILQASISYLREEKDNQGGDVKGRVVFVSSGAATGNTASWGAYNATKASMNSLCRTLASEEPDLLAVAIRPGVVDTEMQRVIREEGKAMSTADYQKFSLLHSQEKLLPPSKPGKTLAELALTGAKGLSGLFVNWDAEEVKEWRDA